ncbi:MAG: ketopantoate reductase family protein [Alistipes sp.]|nr:ketopantoate reductase family protein [Rikenellaceae bacterium]MBQ3082905.1 ketopantoate reductase family protein [Alistipes sp.]
MRIAIYGAGSLGTILGAYIAKGGVAIDLINRNKAHIEALQTKGAQVVGTVQFNQPVTAYTPAEMSGQYDILFLMTKQQYNAEVVEQLKGYLAPDGVLVTFQNGLPEIGIAAILGEERVLGCTVAWGATMQEPGVCELTSSPDALSFSLGAISPQRNKHFEQVKELLELMGSVDIEENFLGTRWSKLLINASFSGMSAVLGCTFGEAAGPRASRRIVQAIIKECIDVCKAGGIRIEPVQGKDIVKLLDYANPLKRAFSFFIIPIAIRKHAKLKASMLQDIEKGKLTEVDAINGAVSAFGRQVGCPTPMNDKVVEIIHRIERGELRPSIENLRLFA